MGQRHLPAVSKRRDIYSATRADNRVCRCFLARLDEKPVSCPSSRPAEKNSDDKQWDPAESTEEIWAPRRSWRDGPLRRFMAGVCNDGDRHTAAAYRAAGADHSASVSSYILSAQSTVAHDPSAHRTRVRDASGGR
jgi:hypothetical protein